MTVPPIEQKDDLVNTDESRQEVRVDPEALASRLRERIRNEVGAFSRDAEERLSANKPLEASLEAEQVHKIRSAAGVDEIPRLARQAEVLGGRAIAAFSDVGRPGISERMRRALRGERPVVVIEDEEITQTPPQEEFAEVEVKGEVEIAGQERIERQLQERIPPEIFRLQRDLKLASAVERLEAGERLEQSDVEMIVGTLEGRGWQKVFNQVKTGDAMVSFLVPNAEQFNIKKFNDVLFGMQKTDDIIKFRRDSLLKEVSALELERVSTSYKDEGYRVPKERLATDGKDGIQKDLSEVAERMRFLMTSKLSEMAAIEWEQADEARKEALDIFVREMIGENRFVNFTEQRTMLLSARHAWRKTVLDEAKALQKSYATNSRDQEAKQSADSELEHAKQLAIASYDLMEQARYTMNTEVIAPALRDDSRRGYRMTFGIAEVGNSKEGDLTHVERAISESLKGAMLARRTQETGAPFSKEDAEGIIKRVNELRERIGMQDLTDTDGHIYPIFEMRPDGHGTTVYRMNLDLIRTIRKGMFKPVSDQRQQVLLEQVKSYIETINILDVTKPYIHGEIAGEKVYGTEQTIAEQNEQTKKLTLRLRDGSISPEERHTLVSLLRQDGKDRACSSTMEFHKKALVISNCSYISLDVLDVGPELLQEYELLLQRVANGRMSFDEAQLIAGDSTTRKMREFRAQVTNAYRELCHGEDPIMSVGGDEIVLAMDTAKMTDEFMLRLRQIKLGDRQTGSIRVVRTAIGTGERVSPSDGDVRKKEHLEAMRKAEDGTAIAKELEKLVRQIQSAINDLPPAERSARTQALHALNMEEFAIHQREKSGDGFELILRDPDESSRTIRANLEGKRQELEAMRNGLVQSASERRERFYAEVVQTHPKVPKELISIALRRKDQSEKGFQDFLKAFS